MNEQIPRPTVVCRHSTERWMKVIVGIVVTIIFIVWILVGRDTSEPLNIYAAVALVLFFSALEVCAVVFTSKRLIVSDKDVVQRTILRERRVPFEEILAAERYVDSHGEEELTIHFAKGRFRCTMSMEDYQPFVEYLAKFVPVQWRKKDTLAFPVKISLGKKTIRHALETVLGFLLAFACAFGCYQSFVRPEGREWSWVLILAALTLVFVVGGVLSQRDFLGKPRGYVFWPNYFDVRLPRFTGRVYGVAIQNIGLRFEKERETIICKLRIQFGNMAVEIASTDTTVPLEPLYAMLREAYLGEKARPSVESDNSQWWNASNRFDQAHVSDRSDRTNPFDQADASDRPDRSDRSDSSDGLDSSDRTNPFDQAHVSERSDRRNPFDQPEKRD